MSNQNDDFTFDEFFDDEPETDITADYDDDEPTPLSWEEREARQEAFEQEVAKRRVMLRKPKNYPAQDRIAAAYWLGEAADPQAIPELVLVYNRDKTKGMKEAATYALGQMKQLQIAFDDPEMDDEVNDILERIVYRDEFGKRFNSSKFIPAYAGLVVSFIVLMIIGVVVGQFSDAAQAQQEEAQGTATAAAPTPTEDTLEFAITDLTNYYTDLNNDARVLQGQMAEVARGNSQDCAIEFANPDSYTLSEARQDDENLSDITDQLNTLRDELAPIRDAFLEACDTVQAIRREDGLQLAQDVISVQNGLRGIESFFVEEAGIEAPATLEFTATPFQSPTPEPTIDFAVIRPHYDTLDNIIVDMTAGIRATANLQQVYWQNIIEFGNSEGCAQPALIVPEDYELPATIASDFPDLESATTSVNTGLALMRESIATFPAACQAADASEAAQIGLNKVNLAIESFNEAQVFLDNMQE